MKNKTPIIIIGLLIIACIICVLAAVGVSTAGIIVTSPSESFKETRDSQRKSDISQLSNALRQYISTEGSDLSELDSIQPCNEEISPIGKAGVDLDFLVPDYLVAIPKDPQESTGGDTGYTICGNDSGEIVLSAPYTEGDEQIQEKISVVESLGADEVDPSDAFVDARNVQRTSDVTQILNAITQYTASGNSINFTTCNIEKQVIGTSGIDLSKTLVPDYLAAIPQDPQVGTDADTGYTICQNNNGRVSVEAPHAEGTAKIQVLR